MCIYVDMTLPLPPKRHAMPPTAPKRRLKPWMIIAGVIAFFLLAMTINGSKNGSTTTSATTTTTTHATTVAPAASAATGPKLDSPGRFACDDFANGYSSAQTKQARVDLANKVNQWAPKSKSGRIAEMGPMLGRGADSSLATWQIAADAFAQACFDAGWK